MKIERVKTIRISLEDGFYCDITPSTANEGFYDFWLYNDKYGIALFMFGIAVENEEHAIELAVKNFPDYIPLLMEQCTE